MTPFRNSNWLKITIVALFIVIGGYFLILRLSEGSRYHALNHIEYSKDNLIKAMALGCKSDALKDFRLISGSPGFRKDDGFAPSNVYRYVVIEYAVTKSDQCLRSIFEQVSMSKYPIKIEIIDSDGKNLATLFGGRK
jgi:hypothetical protein